MSELREKARKASEVTTELGICVREEKNAALLLMADQLVAETEFILQENEKDVAAGKVRGDSEQLLDRLRLTADRVLDMADGLRQVAGLADPVGEELASWERPNGLGITQVRVPLGVVGVVYEARPNVTVDAAGLCLKTGNAVLLRGSSSALCSNKAIVAVIHRALEKSKLPVESVQLLEDTSRETALEMFKLNEFLDVLIPRGGAGLIRTVVNEATVPVLETGVGNCHIFFDESADVAMALAIAVNAKTQRPSVCNAAETILVHRGWAERHLGELVTALVDRGVEIRGCENARVLDSRLVEATEADWGTEFLDLTVALRVVGSVEEAIHHIRKYGTKHSEAIVSEDEEKVAAFFARVDAAVLYHNASTRFTDGFEFGFGAEIGISTQKLHARGPMGLEALTSTKYIVRGSGQVRG